MEELRSIGNRANFIILVRFEKKIESAVVRIAEALMLILFDTWDHKIFKSLRPRALASFSQHCGLNAVSPLSSGSKVVSTPIKTPRSRRNFAWDAGQMGSGGRPKKMEKLIAHAKEGGVVAVTRVVFHNRSQFSFKAMGQKTFVPLGLAQALRLQFLKKINIVYDISHREQHHTPYACKSKDGDPSSHLGIKLEGRHCGGVNEGLEFGKWIKCNSLQAVTKADRIVSLMLGNGWHPDLGGRVRGVKCDSQSLSIASSFTRSAHSMCTLRKGRIRSWLL